MKKYAFLILAALFMWQSGFAQDSKEGVRGDPEAIAEAEAMVETMGGMAIWAQLKSIHFVHEWWPYHRPSTGNDNRMVRLPDQAGIQRPKARPK